MRAEVRPADVELLVVADDAPVDGDVVLEHAVLDEGAELADHLQPQRHRGRVAGCVAGGAMRIDSGYAGGGADPAAGGVGQGPLVLPPPAPHVGHEVMGR